MLGFDLLSEQLQNRSVSIYVAVYVDDISVSTPAGKAHAAFKAELSEALISLSWY